MVNTFAFWSAGRGFEPWSDLLLFFQSDYFRDMQYVNLIGWMAFKGRVISIEIFNFILFNNITVPQHFTSALKVEDFDNFFEDGTKMPSEITA